MATISIILAHPRPGSFNHAIADSAAASLRGNGHGVQLHDLYAEGFEPSLPAAELADEAPLPAALQEHTREIAVTDGIIVVHPNWWGMPPAVLTGWVDRVLRAGVAYRFATSDGGEGVPVGLLKAQAALVFNTANTPEAREKAAFGDPLERIWRDCVFGLCGVRNVHRRTFSVVCVSTLAQRQAWLREVAATVAHVFPRT